MRSIKSQELFEMFYKENKEYLNSLGLSKAHAKSACFAPWLYFKKEIGKGHLYDIHIKYFGKLKVNLGRVIQINKSNEKKFREHKINAEEYFDVKKICEEYFKRKGYEQKT